MKPSIAVHISNMHVHLPSPAATLHSIVERTASADCAGHATPIEEPRGTVIDRSTGLMWSKATTAKGKTLAEAKEAAAAVRLGGYTDWRLPTRAELLTLVDDTRSNPAIDTTKFDCESDWYWTSTPLASSPSGYAWGVLFSDGGAYYSHQVSGGRVRAVRSVSPASPGQ